ncbi:hypothetical protein VX159_11920 [Dechloromonas sp. ZY10]|uniref:hypothetical protein n=1 Tax=Dechloromonas aquae TaxID=2664436 RepID=UPI003529582B
MAFADHLPINESLGVFVGVAGFDWLAEGQAEPLKALLAALCAGVAIALVRQHWKKRRKE